MLAPERLHRRETVLSSSNLCERRRRIMCACAGVASLYLCSVCTSMHLCACANVRGTSVSAQEGIPARQCVGCDTHACVRTPDDHEQVHEREYAGVGCCGVHRKIPGGSDRAGAYAVRRLSHDDKSGSLVLCIRMNCTHPYTHAPVQTDTHFKSHAHAHAHAHAQCWLSLR